MRVQVTKRALIGWAVAVVCVVVVGAATFVEQQPPKPDPKPSGRLLVAEIDASASAGGQRALLENRLRSVIVAAKHRREDVEVWAVDDAPNVGRVPLAEAKFDPGCRQPRRAASARHRRAVPQGRHDRSRRPQPVPGHRSSRSPGTAG